MIYLVIFLAMCLLRGALPRRADRDKVYPAVLVFLAIFVAFRFKVGCDWLGYLNQYEVFGQAPAFLLLGEREAIWSMVVKGLYVADVPYPVLNIIAAAIFFLGLNSLARRQPDRLTFLILSYPMLIMNMIMSAMRQGVAIGIICLALSAFLDRRPWRFVFWVLVAAGFHSSAIVFLLLVPLVGGKLSASRIMLSVLLALPGAALMANSSSTDIMLERYISGREDAAGAAFRVSILVVTALGYLIFLRPRWKRLFPADEKLVTLGAWGMLGTIPLLAVATVVADRLGYYLVPIQLMMFARLPFLRLQSGGALWIVSPFLMLTVVLVVWTSLSWHFDACYMPYQTWLFGFPSAITDMQSLK